MSPYEAYRHLLEDTDPNDPVVSAEIQRGVRHPYGLTDIHDHLPRLRDEAKGNILEIGVRFGASTAALLLGVEEKGGHLWSVDLEDCGIFQGHPQWTFMRFDSTRYADSIKMRLPKELDLLFIDGDHSYDGVTSDLENFGPMAKVVMAHDVSAVENPQVFRAIEHYITSGRCRQKTYALFTDSHGLAVLR